MSCSLRPEYASGMEIWSSSSDVRQKPSCCVWPGLRLPRGPHLPLKPWMARKVNELYGTYNTERWKEMQRLS